MNTFASLKFTGLYARGWQGPGGPDAKYKELESGVWPYEDLYQMLAYCMSLVLPTGMLIYASERPPETHVVERAGGGLRIGDTDDRRPR